MAQNGKYDQRTTVHSPMVPTRVLRKALHWSLEDFAERIAEHLGTRPTKGALSAIETGVRGASAEMVRAMELAFDIELGSIDTEYVPRPSRTGSAAA